MRLSGSGFTGDCGVLFYWGKRDGLVLGGADVSAAGTFAADVRIPADSKPGANKIEVRGREQGLDGCAENSGTVATDSVNVTASKARDVPPIALLQRIIKTAGVDKATIGKAKTSGKAVHAIVQLNRLPQAGDLEALATLGITPLAYLNAEAAQGQAYIAAIAPTIKDADAHFNTLVRAVHPLLAIDKVDLGLAAKTETGESIDSLVLFFTDVAAADATAALARHGVTATRDGRSSTYRAILSPAQVAALAGEDGVQFVAATPTPASSTWISRGPWPTWTPSNSSTFRAPRISA